jgi:SNF2 family DNA or RNA helicase
MLDLIKIELEKVNISYEYLSGQTKNREEKVNSFQSNNQIRVFLISLKAGGVGLNLTQADYIYLVDPWWNPAIENQAIDRSHRIGQKKNVVAVRLICPNTLEEKIRLMQSNKSQLFNSLIKNDPIQFKSITKKDLLEMFSNQKINTK